jgi:sulfur relay (sulfurtransferase) DsrF/TusC family protein
MDGIYMALGAMGELDVSVLFIDDGIYCTMKGQQASSGPSVEDLIYTLYPEARTYVYLQSLMERNVDVKEVVEVVKVVGRDEALNLIRSSKVVVVL